MELQQVARSILSEMTEEINQQIDYLHTLNGFERFVGRDQLVTEATIATWKAAMSLVARQTGIKIKW